MKLPRKVRVGNTDYNISYIDHLEDVNEEEQAMIWQQLSTRIDTINDRTKNHTLEIRELRNKLKEVKNDK